MKILPFIVFSISLLSSYLSQAFLHIPKSPVAINQDVGAANTTSQEKDSLTQTLSLQKDNDVYYGTIFIGNPKKGSTPPPPESYKVMMSLNSVNNSLVTDKCIPDGNRTCPKEVYVPENSDSFTNDTGDNTVKNKENPPRVLGYTGTDNMGFTSEPKLKTPILFRVFPIMEGSLTGLITLSPNKYSFLQVLKDGNQITEQEFMFKTKADSQSTDLSEIQFGGITPGKVDQISWFNIKNEKWQIEANYIAINGKKAQDCNGIRGGAVALFNESSKILLPKDVHQMLLENLKSKKRNSDDSYLCTKSEWKDYPVISIYTSEYKMNITADVYLDFSGKKNDYCPLAVDILNDTNSCITLGYNYFGYSQAVFSKDRQAIGILKKDSLQKLKAFPIDKYSAPIGLGILVLILGVIFVRSSQKEEEIRIDIDNAPRQVRSESFYEYSYSE